jgi:hypothetical protein
MHRFKTSAFLVLLCAALTACAGQQTEASAVAATTALLTPAQQDVLQNGTSPGAVYDAIDGAKIATVRPDEKPSVML